MQQSIKTLESKAKVYVSKKKKKKPSTSKAQRHRYLTVDSVITLSGAFGIIPYSGLFQCVLMMFARNFLPLTFFFFFLRTYIDTIELQRANCERRSDDTLQSSQRPITTSLFTYVEC